MKTLCRGITIGVGLFICFGSPARAQLGELGEAVKKGATDAATQELMKQAGLPTPGTPAATPGADTGSATAPAAPAGAPAATPGADAPADE